MKITGGTTIPAPAEAVWAALHDPGMLTRMIPGCDGLDVVGDGRIRFGITVGLPAVAGAYAGDALITEQSAPELIRLTLAGTGDPGVVEAAIEIRLSPAGPESTDLGYQADAEVGGAIAAIGRRTLAGVAGRLAGEFTDGLTRALAGPAGPPAAGPPLAGQPRSDPVRDVALGVDDGSNGAAADTEPASRAGWSGVKAGLVVTAAVGLSGAVAGVLLRRRLRRGPTATR